MAMSTFDPLKELAEIRQRRRMLRRTRYRKSKLERYRAELVAMRQEGASTQDLAVWLKEKHRLKIHRSSVDRFLKSLPEVVSKMALTEIQRT